MLHQSTRCEFLLKPLTDLKMATQKGLINNPTFQSGQRFPSTLLKICHVIIAFQPMTLSYLHAFILANLRPSKNPNQQTSAISHDPPAPCFPPPTHWHPQQSRKPASQWKNFRNWVNVRPETCEGRISNEPRKRNSFIIFYLYTFH